MPFAVELSPEAVRQAEAVARWWRAQGPGSSALFEAELRAALALLAEHPLLGSMYAAAAHLSARRWLLRRSRYHVYYTVDASRRVIRVLAIWHTARGADPHLE